MNYGAVFPTCDIGSDPIAIRDFAQAAEALGYSHLITYDHVLGAEHANRDPGLFGPYTEHDAFHEPFVLLGYLAALTERIELMPGVLVLPQRQTALVAKQAAELQILSGGRLRLGVGTGWNHVEYQALGADYHSRGERFDEQVKLLKLLWAEQLLDFEGTHHRIDRAGLRPLPEAPIPLWFGGSSAAALRRAVREGDGFLFGAAADFMKQAAATLNRMLAEADREPESFGIDTLIGFGAGPEVWRAEAEAWSALGASSISMRAMSTGAQFIGEADPGFSDPQQHIDALETFIRAVAD